MMARLVRWIRDPEGKRDEKSNSFAIFVVMLPIILGAFGAGVDTSHNIYVRTTLQNALDLAVVGGAATTTTNGGGVVIIDGSGSPPRAIVSVEQVYAKNRNAGPGVSCLNTAIVAGTGDQKCWTQPQPPQLTDTTLFYSVQERSKNSFLQILGSRFAYQELTLESRARINQRTQ